MEKQKYPQYTYSALCQGCFWRCFGVPDTRKKEFDKAVKKHEDLTGHVVSVDRDKVKRH